MSPKAPPVRFFRCDSCGRPLTHYTPRNGLKLCNACVQREDTDATSDRA